MKRLPKIGTTGEKQFVVEGKHAIDFAGMPAVLSTPWLIWFLEHAALELLLPALEPGESSVGTEIELRHLAPTPPGHKVTCLARVIRAEGTQITFQLEAHDERELIARGLHQRQVVSAERFAQRVQRKENRAA